MTEEERIYRQRLNMAMLAARKGEGELGEMYTRISGRIKTRIRKAGANVSVFEVKREVDAAFEAEFAKRVDAVTTAVGQGGALGPLGARETLEHGTRVTGKVVVRANPRAVKAASRAIAARTKARAVVPVSTRIRRWDSELGSEMAREVDRGLRQGRGITDVAKRIQKLDKGYEARLPGYLAEVENAARAGNLDELKGLTSHYTARAKKLLGEVQPDGTRKASAYSLRGATTRFLRDIEKAKGEGIDRVVGKYVEDRAQYQARLIARHETVEAFREGYVRETRDKPGVVGYRWTLSNRHKAHCECDLYANQNAYELGPGVYPADEIPSRHPACICTIVAVMDRDVAQGAAAKADTQSPNAVQWLRQNEQVAQGILGPTRWAAFKEGVPVLEASGKPILVRNLGLRPVRSVRPVAPANANAAAVLRPVRPAAKKAPPKRRVPELPAYGEGAATKPAVLERFTEVRAQAESTMKFAGDRYVGDLPQAFDDHVSAIQWDVAKTFGLKPEMDVSVLPLLATDRHGMTANGSMSMTTGLMRVLVNRARSTHDMLKTVVHETIHTMGGTSAPAYARAAATIEEIATEELAQAYMGGETTRVYASAYGRLSLDNVDAAVAAVAVEPTATFSVVGSYRAQRQRMLAIIASATGETDPVRVTNLARRALQRWKRRRYATAEDAVKAMVDALDPESPQQREFYRRLIDTEDWE